MSDYARQALELQALQNRAQTPEHVAESAASRVPALSAMPNGPPARETALPTPWRDRLHAARCWADLYEILDDAQAAFVAGELPGEIVERLAVQCGVLARRMPEHRLARPTTRGARVLPGRGPKGVSLALGSLSVWGPRGVRRGSAGRPETPGAPARQER